MSSTLLAFHRLHGSDVTAISCTLRLSSRSIEAKWSSRMRWATSSMEKILTGFKGFRGLGYLGMCLMLMLCKMCKVQEVQFNIQQTYRPRRCKQFTPLCIQACVCVTTQHQHLPLCLRAGSRDDMHPVVAATFAWSLLLLRNLYIEHQNIISHD